MKDYIIVNYIYEGILLSKLIMTITISVDILSKNGLIRRDM